MGVVGLKLSKHDTVPMLMNGAIQVWERQCRYRALMTIVLETCGSKPGTHQGSEYVQKVVEEGCKCIHRLIQMQCILTAANLASNP